MGQQSQTRSVTLPLRTGVAHGKPRGVAVIWASSILLAFAAALSPLPLAFRAALAAAILSTGAVLALRATRSRRETRLDEARGPSIVIDSAGVFRTNGRGESTCIARHDEPFGLSILTNPSQSRAVLAFTSAERTRLLAARIDSPEERDAARHALEGAVQTSDGDLESVTGGAASPWLSGRSVARLVAEVEARGPQAMGRIFLSDASGAKVSLDGDKLRKNDVLFDLAEALEWRSFVFFESGGVPSTPSPGAPESVTLYQATWVRQGSAELVLVSPIAGDATSLGLSRGADSPPPRELRVAVDRLFMVPLRKAIEAAPRISRTGAPTRRSSHSIRT